MKANYKSYTKIADILLIIFSLLFIALFLFTSLSRISYKYELEWMEGGQVDHIMRVLEGKSIFPSPSIDFIPYIYTPLYVYVSAAIVSVTGFNPLFVARLVSLLSTLLSSLMIFKIVKLKTQDNFYSILSIGLFYSFFKICGFWYDVARVDSLHILFFVIMIYYLLQDADKHQTKNMIFAGLFGFLSFFTKQSFAMASIPFLLYLLIKNRKSFWIFVAVFAVPAILSTVLYSIATNGFYYFWNFSLPAEHHWNYSLLLNFWTIDILKRIPIDFIILLVLLIISIKKVENQSSKIYIFIIAGMFLCSWLSRLHYGGFLNVLMPVYTSIAIFLPILLFEYFATHKEINRQHPVLVLNKRLIVNCALLVQFGYLLYNPFLCIPTSADKAAGDYFINKISKIQGDVFIPCHSYIGNYAGKRSFAHAMVIYDLMITKGSGFENRMKNILDSTLKKHEFAAVVKNNDWDIPGLDKYYVCCDTIFKNQNVFLTIIGKTRPETIWYPKY